MRRTFKTVDYAQTLELSVHLGDCLPPDHLARFVADSVAQDVELLSLQGKMKRNANSKILRAIAQASLFRHRKQHCLFHLSSIRRKGRPIMANDERIAQLRRGVKRWNVWRQQNPNVQIDLCKTDLIGPDLCEANLREAKLYRADLSHATLDGANLTLSELGGANLSSAHLEKANLDRARLNRAGLRGARLIDANLSGASLFNANLEGANLEAVVVSGASFWGADLRGIPWLIIMDLTLQKGANFSGAQWDRRSQ